MGNQKTPSVYVSYSRRSDYSFIKTLLAKFDTSTELQSLIAPEPDQTSMGPLTEQEPQNCDLDQWDLIYDENGLKEFKSIAGFMEQLSEAGAVVILLSPGYFQSPYCLTELLLLYTKRADDLLPVVVFVDGYQPGDVDIVELERYWDQQRLQAEKNNDNAAANRYAEFSRMLPIILAWLLGTFDEQMEGWDTLFPVVDMDDQQTAAEQVSDALANPIKPRFTHYSSSNKSVWIESRIKKILSRPAIKEWLSGFKVQCSRGSDANPEFAAFLARPQTADHLTENLDHVINWLTEIDINSESSMLRKSLSGDVKELLSYLLMTAIDDVKLHQLIHQLNRLQEQASHELQEETKTALQMIVSAVAFSPVRYRYDVSAVTLQGEGQLELIERGCNVGNYSQWLGDENQWLNVQDVVYEQIIARQFGDKKTDDNQPKQLKTEKALRGAISAELRQRNDYYLLFDKKHLDIFNNHVFRADLGERFPAIQQVVSSDDASNTAENYYLDGLNCGGLYYQILTIYQHLHELAQ